MAWLPVPDRNSGLFTIDQYLALERGEEERHEYLDGCVYAMAGESPDHGTICTNLTILIGSQLRGTPCRAFSKDTKVRCGPSPRPGGSLQGLFAYPDLVIVCGTMQFHDRVQDVLLNPTVILEVLSPSTEAFDRGEKFRRYRTWLPTLADYILVAQDQPLVEHYHRQEEGRPLSWGRGGCADEVRSEPSAHAVAGNGPWTLHTLEGLQAQLHVPSIGYTVALADVYDRIVFPHAEEEAL